MTLVSFLVDGFNLYHSLHEAQLASQGKTTKWLNLRGLCEWVLPQFDRGAAVGEIYYFSALATHRQFSDPTVTARHEAYLSCLRATGITVELGSFKKRDPILCHKCKVWIPAGHEEKQSDVALGVRLVELFVSNRCDGAVVVTGDTDQVPSIATAMRLAPEKPVYVCYPWQRRSDELGDLASNKLALKKANYLKLQFDDPFPLTNGQSIPKPPSW